MFSKRTLLLIAALTTSLHTGWTSTLIRTAIAARYGDRELLPQYNNASEPAMKRQPGETIRFQLFAPGASGRQIQGLHG